MGHKRDTYEEEMEVETELRGYMGVIGFWTPIWCVSLALVLLT